MGLFHTSGQTASSHTLQTLLITTLLLQPAILVASEPSPSNAASQKSQELRHEPIQPLTLPGNLDLQKLSLGERLFHETRLSKDNDMACVSCHDLTSNGADYVSHTPGRHGIKLEVNTLTVFNSTLNHRLFWDGRAHNLGEQIDFVINGKSEFASSWPEIISKLRSDASYVNAFNEAYKNGMTADNLRNALVTFEQSLVTTNSRFDQFLRGDADAITPMEHAGYLLFKAYGCVACHQGKNVGGNLFMKFGVFRDYFAKRGNLTRADLGRFNVTGKERHRYVFRVPSLRLAALTPPYFHDGSVKTLEEAVKVMAEHQLGREIPTEDITCIVAFIKTLPGDYQGRPLQSKAPALKQADAP